MVLDEPLPPVLEESDAVELVGDFMSFVFYETNQRIQKGKANGKGQRKIQAKVEEPSFPKKERWTALATF